MKAIAMATYDAKTKWNFYADKYNQWDSLGKDEKNELIRAEYDNNPEYTMEEMAKDDFVDPRDED